MSDPARPHPLPVGPLGVIVACFFLPCARGCNSPVAPSQALTDKKLWWVFPPFVAALILVGTLLLPWITSRARRFETDLPAFAALGGWALSAPVFWLEQLLDGDHPFSWIGVGAPTLLLGSLLLFRASRGLQPGRGWLLVGSYLAMAAGCPVTVIIAAELKSRPSEPLLGGVLYLASLVALAAMSAVVLVRRRGRPPTSSSESGSG